MEDLLQSYMDEDFHMDVEDGSLEEVLFYFECIFLMFEFKGF
jgi:hypothetical protein